MPILGREPHQPPHVGMDSCLPEPAGRRAQGQTKRHTELGTLRQLHGGRAGGRPGRQAVWGRSLWSLANAGAYCRGFSRADPGTSSGVAGGNAETGLGPTLTVLPGPLPASPHPFPELWAGWLRSLTQPPWAPRRHRLGKWDRSGWPSTTCQHTWHGTRGCRGGLGAAAAPQSH